MSSEPLPRIPLEVFRKMIGSLPLDELRKLPVGKLPREVPADLLRSVEGERRDVLDELLFEANSYHVSERLALENVFGPDLIPALDQAKLDPNRAAVKDSLQRHILGLEQNVEEWLNTGKSESGREAIYRAIPELDAEVKQAFSEKMKLHSYQKMLRDGFHLAGEYQAEFKSAIQMMQNQEKVFDEWVGRYYRTRLVLVTDSLDVTHQDVEEKNKRLKTIVWEIAEIKKRIQSSQEAQGLTLAEANQNHFIQELNQELLMMERMKPDYDVIIPENNLTRWLDIVLDAALCPIESNILEAPLKETKEALFRLILVYCDVQSEAAEKISEQEFSLLDKEKNIQYMLESERFMLKYFKNKTPDVKSWGVGEEQLEKLAQFEQDVLDCIRKATHFNKPE